MDDPTAPADLDPLDPVLAAVGPRLRALRHAGDATLAQLGEATGISVSVLSRLESGQRRPTHPGPAPAAGPGTPGRARRPRRRAADRRPSRPPRPVTRYGMTWLPLTRRRGGLQAYKLVPPVQAPPAEPRQQAHEGWDWLYVLSGQLRLLLGGHDLTLTHGQVAEFDTRTPHWFGNPGPSATKALGLFGPQRERLHVSPRPGSR